MESNIKSIHPYFLFFSSVNELWSCGWQRCLLKFLLFTSAYRLIDCGFLYSSAYGFKYLLSRFTDTSHLYCTYQHWFYRTLEFAIRAAVNNYLDFRRQTLLLSASPCDCDSSL